MQWLPGILVLLGTACAQDTASSTGFKRPARSLELPLEHPLLSRAPGSPHQPEQVHLALSTGAVAISWVTHPQVRCSRAAGSRQRRAAGFPPHLVPYRRTCSWPSTSTRKSTATPPASTCRTWTFRASCSGAQSQASGLAADADRLAAGQAELLTWVQATSLTAPVATTAATWLTSTSLAPCIASF